MKRALGHRVTPFAATHAVPHISEHPRFGVQLLGATPSLVDLSPSIFDQGSTSTCEGHASAACIAIECAASGAPLPWVPSMVHLYRNALATERATFPSGVNEPLSDDGTDCPAILAGLATYGVRAMVPLVDRYSDADPATVCDEPTIDEEIAGASNPLVGAYDLPLADPHLVDTLESALAARIPVMIEAFVDSAYMQATADTVVDSCDPNDPHGGGHAQAIVGVRIMPDGSPQFRVRNSWGTSWGDGGYVWVTPNFIRSAMRLTAFAVRRTA